MTLLQDNRKGIPSMKKPFKSCLIIVLIFFFVILVGILVMFLARICPPAGPWPMPPWCSAGNTSTFLPSGTDQEPDQFSYLSSDQIKNLFKSPALLISPDKIEKISEIHADGVAWYTLSQDKWAPMNVKAFHAGGLHLLGASMTIRHLNVQEAKSKIGRAHV